MRYVQGVNRDQTLLLPETLDEYVSPENPVRVIDAFVDDLDLEALGFTHAPPKELGRKPYNPADLLKLYTYGYLNKIRSSRRLETEACRNVEVLWLLCKLRPDFKTIADFRKDNTKAIKQVCRKFTLLCKKLDLFGKELVGIDGTKINAVNHNSRVFDHAKLRRQMEQIDERVENYLHALNENDAPEVHVPKLSADEIQERIATLKSHRAELEQIQKELEASGEKQIALTDTDSRMMRTSKGTRDVAYNVQFVVDDKHMLVVEHEVTNDCNDTHHLAHMALQAKATLGVETLEALADAGYFEKEEIKTCEDQQIACYVPEPNKSQNHARGMYTERDFHYDATQDCYMCPAQQQVTYRCATKKSEKDIRVYEGAACRTCALRAQCTTSQSNNRRIYRWVHEDIIDKMRARMAQQPEKMKRRAQLVEHPFGTLKHAMNHSYFLLRGKEKVSAEMSLSVLVYNLKRVMNILGVKELLAALVQKG